MLRVPDERHHPAHIRQVQVSSCVHQLQAPALPEMRELANPYGKSLHERQQTQLQIVLQEYLQRNFQRQMKKFRLQEIMQKILQNMLQEIRQ